MKLSHFQEYRPVCPACRLGRTGSVSESPLELGLTSEQTNGDILSGVLVCTNSVCRQEYPILDGIPILVADLPNYFASHLPFVMFRDDLPESVATLIGDACGPGSNYDIVRQQMGAYAWDHYADLDPDEAGHERQIPGACLRLLEAGWEQTEETVGLVIDLGCSSGRTTFELGERHPTAHVLGIDLNFGMLRTASRVLRHGSVQYDRREVGLVYQRRQFPVEFPGAEHVDFWVADATALPFPAQVASRVNALNVLDCVSNPLGFLQEIERVLCDQGLAFVATPFDWNPGATSMDAWLGGHSQRGPGGGNAASLLRSLLQRGQHPQSLAKTELVREWDSLSWRVRCHARSMLDYDAYGVLVRKRD